MASYSVVIATCDREKSLHETLADWSGQTVKPEKVVVCETKAKESSVTGVDCGIWAKERKGPVPLEHLTSDVASAAKQRNLGAERVSSEWIVFSDDDVRFGPKLAEEVVTFLDAHPEAVAVFPRMLGSGHLKPGRFLRSYYQMQAGWKDEHYGARLFGPGISTYPCWEVQKGPVEANWLPSTLLWIKAELFRRHRFPDFEGYSYGEDAHLTHRVWREVRPEGKMYFLAEPEFKHKSVMSGVKTRRFHLARMAIRNQRKIAREAMGMGVVLFFVRSIVHRIFLTFATLKARRSGWLSETAGTWTAF